MLQDSLTPVYVQNPDAILREQDEDGGLLFNPDTNQVKVINITGLFIWQKCAVAQTVDDLIIKVKQNFIEVPTENVDKDVKEFVDEMLADGFLGCVDNIG